MKIHKRPAINKQDGFSIAAKAARNMWKEREERKKRIKLEMRRRQQQRTRRKSGVERAHMAWQMAHAQTIANVRCKDGSVVPKHSLALQTKVVMAKAALGRSELCL